MKVARKAKADTEKVEVGRVNKVFKCSVGK